MLLKSKIFVLFPVWMVIDHYLALQSAVNSCCYSCRFHRSVQAKADQTADKNEDGETLLHVTMGGVCVCVCVYFNKIFMFTSNTRQCSS